MGKTEFIIVLTLLKTKKLRDKNEFIGHSAVYTINVNIFHSVTPPPSIRCVGGQDFENYEGGEFP